MPQAICYCERKVGGAKPDDDGSDQAHGKGGFYGGTAMMVTKSE